MSGKLKIVYVNKQVQLQQCSLYNHKHAVMENHHVCPESWWVKAGKPVASQLRKLCPNCHVAVHVCIDGILTKKDVSLLPIRCKKLAETAFIIALANGLTPARTL